MAENTPLKPCPFCGGESTLREVIEHYDADGDSPAGSFSAWFMVSCNACGVEVGDEYRDDAIAAWNRRAPTQDAETIQALRDQIATKDEALAEARTQVQILQDRLGIKDTGCGTLSIIDAALSASQKETK